MKDVCGLCYASRTVFVHSACFSTCLHHSVLSCATFIHSCEISALWPASMFGLHLATQDSHLRTCRCLLCPCLSLPNLSSCFFSQADRLQITISFACLLSLMRAMWPAHRKRLGESLCPTINICRGAPFVDLLVGLFQRCVQLCVINGVHAHNHPVHCVLTSLQFLDILFSQVPRSSSPEDIRRNNTFHQKKSLFHAGSSVAQDRFMLVKSLPSFVESDY